MPCVAASYMVTGVNLPTDCLHIALTRVMRRLAVGYSVCVYVFSLRRLCSLLINLYSLRRALGIVVSDDVVVVLMMMVLISWCC